MSKIKSFLKYKSIYGFVLFPIFFCESTTIQASEFEMPNYFRVQGSAIATLEGLDIECKIDLISELNKEQIIERSIKIYKGNMGGELSRSSTDNTGAGISFFANTHGEIEMKLYPNERVEILWGSFSHFHGKVEKETVSGTWICAPFNTRGDTVGTITGNWEVIPITNKLKHSSNENIFVNFINTGVRVMSITK